MSVLEIVRAGAGSGKTTDLCATVASAVADGLDPARILATTFTKKAAAELKGRIQARLLEGSGGASQAHFHADRLELAAIGTVHSVAHRLLSRYAIELGLSPRLEVVTEQAGERTLKELLAAIPLDSWRPLAESAERLGIDDLHPRLLALLAAKRGNRIGNDRFRQHMTASAVRVCELLASGQPLQDGDPVEELLRLADEALQAIETLGDNQQNTAKACRKLRQLRSSGIPPWAKYVEASRITAGKRSGADDCLDTLRTVAAQVRWHRQLHDDVRAFGELLAAETIRLGGHYDGYKTERGLVDFTDLEIRFLELLDHEAIRDQLAEDFDLILVDEFQDTNPLQLAIFQRLRRCAPRNRWVGDHKQAIYGFRDTDPQLVHNVWETADGAQRTTLPNNYRSQRGLVQLVGELFAPLLGEDARQLPRKDGQPRGVERWLFDSKNKADDFASLACGVAQLRGEGIPLSDIVVLARANADLEELAAAFDDLGIPFLLESPGLLDTREGALALSGLRLVADRSDSLAAATCLHLTGDPGEATPRWLLNRLKELRQSEVSATEDAEDRHGEEKDNEPAESAFRFPWAGEPRLSRLEAIDPLIGAPTSVMHQVIEALELPDLVPRWGDPARRCSHLDSLLRHATEYEEAMLAAGQAATLSGLILYLERLAGEGQDVRYPPRGHEAVTLMTYHAAKGLEWPVVILTGRDSQRGADMWSPMVGGGGDAIDDPLAGRTLRAWTWPFGHTDGPYGGPRKGTGLEGDALQSPEGQDRSAREQAESLRLLYVGCTRAKKKLVFAHREGKGGWLEGLSNLDALLDPALDDGEHELAGIDTTLVIRRLSPDDAEACRIPRPRQERWFALPERQPAAETRRRYHAPSAAGADHDGSSTSTQDVTVEHLPGPSHFPSGAGEGQFAAIGDAVHAYLAALPSMRPLSEAARRQVAERCLSAHRVTGLLSPQALVSCGERFAEWVARRYPGACWHTEVPLTAPRPAGGQWHGTADLLLELENGRLILIDHKSAPIRREHCQSHATRHLPQLTAYHQILTSARHSLHATHLHFPLAGAIASF